MKVELASADLHLHLTKTYGRPTPTQNNYDELVGDYLSTGAYYWFFNPKTDTWRVLEDRPDFPRRTLIDTGWGAEAKLGAEDLLADIKDMAPPSPPLNLNEPSEGAPFFYKGWLFQWFYFPQLARWELAPVRKA